jgi:hypothetical protein
MKKLLLSACMLLGIAASAQIVNIPDPGFKDYLLDANIQNSGVAKGENNNDIVIDANGDGEIQQTEALLIWGLHLNGVEIHDVTGLEAFTNLRTFTCDDNANLINLDLTPLINLENFQYLNYIDGTGLEFLSLAGLSNLKEVLILGSNLDTINLTGLTAMEEFTLHKVPVTHIDYSDMANLRHAGLGYTNIVNVDLSNNHKLRDVRFGPNPLLEYLNLKNGSLLEDEELVHFANNPNLHFVCVDEDENLAQFFNYYEMPVFSSYCSFTPGGNYNTISGAVIFDLDGNGCDETDMPHRFLKVHINDGINEGYTFTDNEGKYKFYTAEGNFTVTPQFEDDWFTPSPANAGIIFSDENNNIHEQDFCLTGNGTHSDVEVLLVPVTSARPGFLATYNIIYRNKGNQTISGNIACNWNDDVLNEEWSNPTPAATSTGAYSWGFIDLLPLESRVIEMNFTLNAPTAEPPVNDGDILHFDAAVTYTGTDETPEDNTFALDQVVVNSFDPNIITCLEGKKESPEAIGDYLHYVVDFENTGTAPARFIVVKHQINPAYFDINSLQLINSSHDVQVKVNGDIIEFYFQDINLAAAHHGNIVFGLRTVDTLEEGDSVKNKANIYFDYNYPIVTNNATTQFLDETAGIGDNKIDNSVKVYPNPSKAIVKIDADSPIKSFMLYDIQGRQLQTVLAGDTTVSLDLSGRASGIYFLKITTDKGVKVEKLIRE